MQRNVSLDGRSDSERLDGELSLLAVAECRYVCYYFGRNSDDEATLGELAEYVRRLDAPRVPDSRARIAARLHHLAVPKLDEAGVVAYDEEGNTVTYRGSQTLESLVAVTADDECDALA
ncbi:DUF7344 domain-containing protein [Halorussus salinus]|uniref:DUF7344 domain-containing protein n=1 Tax=Halorussus salinus TaxID=1364935 RepID=UPI0010918855|nr:hypothetical protein [Halorussus salinus]